MKKCLISLLCVCLLSGCTLKEKVQEQTDNVTSSMQSFDNSYYKIVNFGGSELRENFYLGFGTSNDFLSIGRGLQQLSSSYFSTSDYYMSEGQYLGAGELNELLRRAKNKSIYPYTLQPEKGSSIEGVFEPIMVSSVQEQDYYVKEGNNYVLKGVSFAIVLNPTTANGETIEPKLSDQSVKNYGKQCIEKLYKFIKEYDTFKKIKNLPILITVYQATDRSSSTIDGHYILKSLCEKKVGNIENVNYQTVYFTGKDAEELDKVTHSEFEIIKTKLKNAAIEAAGFQGTARYVNNEIQSMVINANLNTKTYTELIYLTDYIASLIEDGFTYDFDIKVIVNSQDATQAVIIKERGQGVKSSLLY